MEYFASNIKIALSPLQQVYVCYGARMDQSVVADVTQALAKHVSTDPPEDMQMAHVLHWALCFSIEDAATDQFLHMRVLYPTNQPHYVTEGLVNASLGLLYQSGDE